MARTGRVLVVEDEADIGQVMVAVLADEGHEVRWATNGRDGLAVLRDWVPDVTVLDLMMPVLDGRAFRGGQRLLASPAARVPVVVVSGAREARGIADELGAVATLIKPFDLDELVATVGRVLDPPPA